MSDRTDLFAGPGEAAALMRSIDWAATSLGAPDGWPSNLCTLIPIMLASRFAMRVLWGPELVMLYNDAYRPVLGSSKHPRAMGRPVKESYAELWHIVGPLFERVFQGESVSLDDGQLPIERHGYLEECYFTLSYSPIPDNQGAIRGVLGVVYETTGRVLSQRWLKTLGDLSATAVATNPELACAAVIEALARNPADVPFAMVYLVDGAGSSARLGGATGLAMPSALAPPVIALSDDATWPVASAVRERHAIPVVLDPADPVHAGPYPEVVSRAVVSPLYRPGVAAPCAILVTGVNPRRELGGEYRKFIELAAEHIATSISNGAAYDERARLIASEQAARADAEHSNRAKDEFLAVVSHELRNPLSAILGWTHMLQSAQLTADKRARALETIERNAVNQSQLIDDLLDISRIVAGTLRLEVTSVNFVELIENAIESARPAITAKQLALQTVLDTRASMLLGDSTRLQQVVWNLLTNATKFTPKGGTISVVLSRIDSMLELEVRDNGTGITVEFLPHVFERFKQADSTTTRTHGGLGLGLSITRNIVEMHGGTIEARSEGLGRGAAFVVRIPIAPVRPQPEARRDEPAQERVYPPELVGLHVLVVDDDQDGRQMIGSVLEECGARVSLAASVEEALAVFDQDRPDVILSDIGMPIQDGYALIRQVRARTAADGGSTPAASLTAYAGVEDRRRALNAGFNMHVPKPVDPAELIAVIASLGRFAQALRHE